LRKAKDPQNETLKARFITGYYNILSEKQAWQGNKSKSGVSKAAEYI
jgi:hypothetical protein